MVDKSRNNNITYQSPYNCVIQKITLRRIRDFILNEIKRPLYNFRFKSFGKKSSIFSPLYLDGTKNISIGSYVNIQYKTWLAALPLTGEKKCQLHIGDGSSIGNFNHIYATKEIIIGKNVLTADKVYISDNIHGYGNINMPIKEQQVIQKNGVYIGDDSWIGENVSIIGASIGKHCVIGANSVVTKNIPNYCVAAGIPAKIIKRYNPSSNIWEKTDSKGNFIVEK